MVIIDAMGDLSHKDESRKTDLAAIGGIYGAISRVEVASRQGPRQLFSYPLDSEADRMQNDWCWRFI